MIFRLYPVITAHLIPAMGTLVMFLLSAPPLPADTAAQPSVSTQTDSPFNAAAAAAAGRKQRSERYRTLAKTIETIALNEEREIVPALLKDASIELATVRRKMAALLITLADSHDANDLAAVATLKEKLAAIQPEVDFLLSKKKSLAELADLEGKIADAKGKETLDELKKLTVRKLELAKEIADRTRSLRQIEEQILKLKSAVESTILPAAAPTDTDRTNTQH